MLNILRPDELEENSEEQLMEICDHALSEKPDKELLSIAYLSKLCTHIDPTERPTMMCRDAYGLSVVDILT